MTPDEFQSRYQDYSTTDIETAKAACAGIEIEGDQAVVVGPLLGRYCLMLLSAAQFMGTLDDGGVVVS